MPLPRQRQRLAVAEALPVHEECATMILVGKHHVDMYILIRPTARSRAQNDGPGQISCCKYEAMILICVHQRFLCKGTPTPKVLPCCCSWQLPPKGRTSADTNHALHEQRAPAIWRASVRMAPKQAARSVTPTAPRASRMLNAWLSFSSCPYAGMGSPASTSRCASCAHTVHSVFCLG